MSAGPPAPHADVPNFWQRCDYAATLLARSKLLRQIRQNPQRLPSLRRYYAQYPEVFLEHWGWVAEPRNSATGLPTELPLCLWPRQRKLVRWMVARWRSDESGVVVKARDSGASWLSCCVGAPLALLVPGTVVGYGSRKVELVDGTPKAQPSTTSQQPPLTNIARSFIYQDSPRHS